MANEWILGTLATIYLVEICRKTELRLLPLCGTLPVVPRSKIRTETVISTDWIFSESRRESEL